VFSSIATGETVESCQKHDVIEGNYGNDDTWMPAASTLCYVREDQCKDIFSPISDQEFRQIQESVEEATNAQYSYFRSLTSASGESAKRVHVLCEKHEEDNFSKTIIDSTLTSFDEKYIRLVKQIYERMAYDSE
jgi:hypothetical protein